MTLVVKRKALFSSLALVLLVMTLIFDVAPQANAAAARQVAGRKSTDPSGYIGVDSWVSYSPNGNSGQRYTPIAVTNYGAGGPAVFMESGTGAVCDNSGCTLRPYYAYQLSNGFYMSNSPAVYLTNGVGYHYFTNRISGTTWQAAYCFANSPCYDLISTDMGVSTFPYAFAGAETDSTSTAFGTANYNPNGYNSGATGTYYGWGCYDDVVGYGNSYSPSSYISGCGTNSDFSITM